MAMAKVQIKVDDLFFLSFFLSLLHARYETNREENLAELNYQFFLF